MPESYDDHDLHVREHNLYRNSEGFLDAQDRRRERFDLLRRRHGLATPCLCRPVCEHTRITTFCPEHSPVARIMRGEEVEFVGLQGFLNDPCMLGEPNIPIPPQLHERA